MKKRDKEEFNNLRDKFTARLISVQSKSLENNVDLEFPARATSITLWTLKSVTRLGMFMTKTELEAFQSKFQTRNPLGFENDITDSISYTESGNEYRKELEDAGFDSYSKEKIQKLTDSHGENQSNNIEFIWPPRTSKISLLN